MKTQLCAVNSIDHEGRMSDQYCQRCVCVSGGLCGVLCHELGQLQLHIFIGQRALANRAQILSEWMQAMKSSSRSQTPSPCSGSNIIYTFKGLLWVLEFRSMCWRERNGEKEFKEEATWAFIPTFFVLITPSWTWHADRLNYLGFIMVSSQTAWMEDVSELTLTSPHWGHLPLFLGLYAVTPSGGAVMRLYLIQGFPTPRGIPMGLS